MTTTSLACRLFAVAILFTVALPAGAETLEEMDRRALRHAVLKLIEPDTAPIGMRKPVTVAWEKGSKFRWHEIAARPGSSFEAKYFPHMSFICVECGSFQEEWSHSYYAVDRTTGAVRLIQKYDIDGLVQDEAVFIGLVREATITLTDEAGVKEFVDWANKISHSPQGMFGACGNSKFASTATKVEGGWKFVSTVDAIRDRAWLISCDAGGMVTGLDRNLMKIPPPPTREQVRARRAAEKQRKEAAKAWWVEEAQRADLAALTAKADLIGEVSDFTPQSGTGRLYRVFTFSAGGLRFGDRLGNYSGDFYMASVQFPAATDRRFDIDPSDTWIVFLTARLDQGYHPDSRQRFRFVYEPAGEHAVLRATPELLEEMKRLAALKKEDAARNAAVRRAVMTDSVEIADARNYLIQARYAAQRFTEWSAATPDSPPDADNWRKSFVNQVYAFLRAAGPVLDRATLVADPMFRPFHDDEDGQWQRRLASLKR